MQREAKLSVLSFRSIPISSKVLVVLIVLISDSAQLPISKVREIKNLRRERFGMGLKNWLSVEWILKRE
jgi:hypothetical protein